MKNQKEMNENEKILGWGVKWYKKKIIDMLKHIEEERFLKAIYISMSDYLKEKEPD